MTATIEVRAAGRLRDAWAAAHHPVPGVPRWARNAAYAVPYTVLPSSLWRIAVCTFHTPIGRGQIGSGTAPSGVPGVPLGLYVIVLSVVSELLAFTAVGLVSTWGEVVPRWIPVLHGRRVPTLAAVVPAALGAAALTLLWTGVAVSNSLGMGINGSPLGSDSPLSLGDWKGLVATIAYAPLLVWGTAAGGGDDQLLEAAPYRPPSSRRSVTTRGPRWSGHLVAVWGW
jgi:hypothetical protein